jgi:hypothetical protein
MQWGDTGAPMGEGVAGNLRLESLGLDHCFG